MGLWRLLLGLPFLQLVVFQYTQGFSQTYSFAPQPAYSFAPQPYFQPPQTYNFQPPTSYRQPQVYRQPVYAQAPRYPPPPTTLPPVYRPHPTTAPPPVYRPPPTTAPPPVYRPPPTTAPPPVYRQPPAPPVYRQPPAPPVYRQPPAHPVYRPQFHSGYGFPNFYTTTTTTTTTKSAIPTDMQSCFDTHCAGTECCIETHRRGICITLFDANPNAPVDLFCRRRKKCKLNGDCPAGHCCVQMPDLTVYETCPPLVHYAETRREGYCAIAAPLNGACFVATQGEETAGTCPCTGAGQRCVQTLAPFPQGTCM